MNPCRNLSTSVYVICNCSPSLCYKLISDLAPENQALDVVHNIFFTTHTAIAEGSW